MADRGTASPSLLALLHGLTLGRGVDPYRDCIQGYTESIYPRDLELMFPSSPSPSLRRVYGPQPLGSGRDA